MAQDRSAATNVTVFSVASQNYLGYVENATFKGDVKHVESKGVGDQYRYPWAVDGGWDVDGDFFYGQGAQLMPLVGQSVTIAFTLGSTNYSGQALVTSGSHMAHNADIQKQKLTFIGQGAPTIQTG